ncbi:MAG: hypothetical protein QM817_13810 [Archangium sp.]
MLERIEREHEERVARRPVELRIEREARAREMADAGEPLGEIIRMAEMKAADVRALLGLSREHVDEQARLRELARRARKSNSDSVTQTRRRRAS